MSSTGSLRCTPEQRLEFEVIGGTQSQVNLRLDNTTSSFVAFKIKTTAPKSYLVKPSSGVIHPNGTQNVSILLIPLLDPPKEPVNDRFLIQSAVVESDAPLTREQWTDMSKDRLEERRLQVVFNWRGFPSSGTEVSEPFHKLIQGGVPGDYNELKDRFQQLCTYAVSLEKAKNQLEVQLDELRKQNQSASGVSNRSLIKGNAGLQYWQVGLIVLAVVLGLKVIKFL